VARNSDLNNVSCFLAHIDNSMGYSKGDKAFSQCFM